VRARSLVGAASFIVLGACAGAAPTEPPSVEARAPDAIDSAPARPGGSAPPRRTRPTEPDDPTADALTIEQDGVVVPSVHHEARVGRRAFAVVVRIRGGGPAALLGTSTGVYLNASFDSRLFDLAALGKAQPAGDGDAFGDGSAMAEEAKPEPTLFLASGGSHYWYWESDTDNRCSSAARDGDDILCRRVVESLSDSENGLTATPIAKLSAPALYLVSRQRPSATAHGFVKLTFDPP